MVRRLTVAAVTNDALATEEIRRVEVPSFVDMWASCDDAGDQCGLLLNKTEIMPSGDVNVEIAADVIDTSRDQCVFNEFVGAGQLRVPVPVVTAELQFILSVRPALG
jgi:hypothetical protein